MACASWASPSSSQPLYDTDYDRQIQRAVDRYWPAFPFWRSWKAQLYQESLLDPEAVSPVGARGLAQFMPGTWQEVAQELGYGDVSPHLAGPAIEAGAYYMAKLRKTWSSPRPEEARHKLAQASYNAGAGNIIKAQRLCDGALLWRRIRDCLPQVTGHHSQETITYVQRIERWWRMLEAGR